MGLSCPIGQFMTPRQFLHIKDNGLETKSWRTLVDHRLAPSAHADILSDLQLLHDKFSPSVWEDKLLYMSRQLNLPQP